MSALKNKSFLGYELSSHQDAILNYLLPSVISCTLYILVFSSDVGVVFRHYKDENPIFASVTLFVIYLPSLTSYILIVSDWALWPKMYDCGLENIKWFIIKTMEHLLFPAWAMWRYAERIFWSIEAVRGKDDDAVKEATSIVTAPRTIELYFFLQAFLHSLPQMLVQLNILMRQETDTNKQSADAAVLSLVFNLAKLSTTVTFYHRFKTQKLAGRQYPWYKSYKQPFHPSIDQIDSSTREERTRIRPIGTTEPVPSDSRRSSDIYMAPTTPPLKRLREVDDPQRQTSIVDGPKRKVYRDEPDFNIRRVAMIKGLPEDDLAGKLVSFLWWFLFLLVRILAISAFYYFYPTATYWLIAAHIVFVISFLVYDVKSDEVKRAKAVFFVFLGLIYVFCVIEFKIKFKKTKFIYIGYFSVVFAQNFIMCAIWWFNNVEDLKNEFWFRYIFYIVISYSVLSVSAMMLYLNINKPEKVVVGEEILQ